MSGYKNVHEMILATAASRQARPAFRHIRPGTVREISYKELAPLTARFAEALADRGLKAGDHVALCADNSAEWALVCLACWRLNLVVVPLDPRTRVPEVQAILKQVKPKLFILGRMPYGTLGEALDAKKTMLLEDLCHKAMVHGESTNSPTQLKPASPNTPAVIVFSLDDSGTTRGVVLSHSNLVNTIASVGKRLPFAAGDKVLCTMPLSNPFSLISGLLLPLSVGCTVIHSRLRGLEHLKELLKIEQIPILIASHNVFYNILRDLETEIGRQPLPLRTAAALTRHALIRNPENAKSLGRVSFGLLHKQLGNPKFWLASGSPVSADLLHSFASFGIQVIPTYGLPQTTAFVACNSELGRPASTGTALPGVELRIHWDGTTKSTRRGPMNQGEILVRGPNVMVRYLDEPKNSAHHTSEGGWFHTGDVGYIDPGGRLHITGRLKSTIATPGGYTMEPQELESLLKRSPVIEEACVVANRSRAGEQPVAVIVPSAKLGNGKDSRKKLQQEVSAVLSQLEEYKRLVDFVVTDKQLPRTVTGELNRAEISQLYRMLRESEPTLSGTSNKPTVWDEDGQRVVLSLLQVGERTAVYKPSDVPARALLSGSFGIDSFSRLALAIRLEEEFGVEIPEDGINDVQTVEELVALVKSQKQLTAARYGDKSATTVEQDEFMRALNSYQSVEGQYQPPGKVKLWPQSHVPKMLSSYQDDPLLIAARRTIVVGARLLMQIYNDFDTEGAARLSLDPPFIVAANHTSNLDVVALFASFPANLVKLVHPVAAADVFFADHLTSMIAAHLFNAIPYDRFSDIDHGLQACEEVLRRGRILIVFPEGKQSATGKLQPFKSGAAKLAITVGCPILPAYISGAKDVLPDRSIIPHDQPLSVKFGTPLYPPPPPADVAMVQEFTRKLKLAIHELGKSNESVKVR